MSYLKVEKLSIKYCVGMTIAEMLKVIDKDVERFDNEEQLYDRLVALDYIVKVEYNGMFGPYVFLEIAYEDDTSKNWREILGIIENYIK